MTFLQLQSGFIELNKKVENLELENSRIIQDNSRMNKIIENLVIEKNRNSINNAIADIISKLHELFVICKNLHLYYEECELPNGTIGAITLTKNFFEVFKKEKILVESMGFNFYDNKDEYHVQLKMQELHGLLFEFLESKNIPIFIYLAMVQLKIKRNDENHYHLCSVIQIERLKTQLNDMKNEEIFNNIDDLCKDLSLTKKLFNRVIDAIIS